MYAPVIPSRRRRTGWVWGRDGKVSAKEVRQGGPAKIVGAVIVEDVIFTVDNLTLVKPCRSSDNVEHVLKRLY